MRVPETVRPTVILVTGDSMTRWDGYRSTLLTTGDLSRPLLFSPWGKGGEEIRQSRVSHEPQVGKQGTSRNFYCRSRVLDLTCLKENFGGNESVSGTLNLNTSRKLSVTCNSLQCLCTTLMFCSVACLWSVVGVGTILSTEYTTGTDLRAQTVAGASTACPSESAALGTRIVW